ncbi:hypothetical protein L484_024156 [Morus notabilis]|uniref:Uncharacterized protein n=1 Tax=Morus notabilis TaxID=981085 RepID=W9RXN8_9ROSA|nr:hypothetical protein L484_024156 [Morus notabilis]
MAKAKSSLCKTKSSNDKNEKTMKKKDLDFSESEIDVAEQLIQLSGDSDNNDNNNNNNNIHEEIISDGDTTHLINNTLNRMKSNLFDDQEDDGLDPRGKKKRFKSLSEIYSLTCKPLSDNIVNNVQ